MAGEILHVQAIDVSSIKVANATANVTISNVAPAAVTTATISAWMKVIVEGVEYYIPMWT